MSLLNIRLPQAPRFHRATPTDAGFLDLPGHALIALACCFFASAHAAAANRVTAEGVAERIKDMKRGDSMMWKQIPWVASLTEAEKISSKEGSPIFLFAHDGNISTGRC